ncbi:MAG: Yip1 domain protein [Pedosphaera sp.]|nr:Yip1 domain protein [Pedosphaera sp.]
MIKALLLIFKPAGSWARIVQAKRSLGTILVAFLIPLIALSIAGELLCMKYLAKPQPGGMVPRISTSLLINYVVVQFVLGLVAVFLSAKLVKSLAETFHARNSYTQCFTLVAYSVSPLFLLHILDGVPGIPPWLGFIVGILLSLAVLYNGIPTALNPDPPHAFGLFLTSGLLLTMVCGVARLIAYFVLQKKFHFS